MIGNDVKFIEGFGKLAPSSVSETALGERAVCVCARARVRQYPCVCRDVCIGKDSRTLYPLTQKFNAETWLKEIVAARGDGRVRRVRTPDPARSAGCADDGPPRSGTPHTRVSVSVN